MNVSALFKRLKFLLRVTNLCAAMFITIPVLCAQDTQNSFPLITPVAMIKNGGAILKPVIKNYTGKSPLVFKWDASNKNPAKVIIRQRKDGSARVTIPKVNGDFRFELMVTSGKDTERLQTYVTRFQNRLTAFDFESMTAGWISKTIIYQVTPYIFAKNAKYPDIQAKLDDLADMGINTLYLQPVFKTQKGGQGYDVTDYFSLREDLGTEQQLRSLIAAAKLLNMRVLFDMVPNHTSVHHPYAMDRIAQGKNSTYYDFYQRTNDGAKYSSHYHNLPDSFICYFWNDLVNLNFDNEQVQRMMIDACKYWVKKFDIDGYRFDAVWAVNARSPLFGKRLQTELKSIKPDLLLIAEDKATTGDFYKSGFDAAYDWTKDTGWISQWSWQYQFDKRNEHTLFNHPSLAARKQLLRSALFDNDYPAKTLRFLENNDQHRFISNHSVEVTKMAAGLLFALPGLPMMYNGQEIGFKDFPYKSRPIFDANKSIREQNPELFNFYKRIIAMRKSNDALMTGTMEELPVKSDSGAVAFLRNTNNQHILVLVNLAPAPQTFNIKFTGKFQWLVNAQNYTDLFSQEKFPVNPGESHPDLSFLVEGYTTRVLLLQEPTKKVTR